jgi:hypothetical protein
MTHQQTDSTDRGRFWLKVAAVAGVYLSLQLLMLLGTGVGWQKFWVLQPVDTFQYWDAIHYADLAVNPFCSAFYPLWPALVRWVAQPDTAAAALRVGIPGSALIFLGSLPLALLTFERLIRSPNLALLAFVLYALGPNAVFQAIGYTESLFGLLSLLFLLCLHGVERGKENRITQLGLYLAIFGLSVALNLVRPILLQTGFAIAFTLIVLGLIPMALEPGVRRFRWPIQPLIVATLIGVGSLVGYSLYGRFCLNTMGSFLGPFQAQLEWGRTFAFRPWLLLFPRSLFMDIHGLYTPALIFVALGWVLWAGLRQRPSLQLPLPRHPGWYVLLAHPLVFTGVMAGLNRFGQRWLISVPLPPTADLLKSLGRFPILYAIALSGIHSVINFLANSGYLYSTARHYFGTPFAFVGIGAILAAFSSPQLNRLGWVIAAMGLLWLGEQWFHYGTGRWLG